MSNYRIHIYVILEEPYDHNRWTCVRRENVDTGEFQVLRTGCTTWPEAIAKTLVQVEVPVVMYEITEEQYDLNAWHEATVIPEEQW